LNQFVHLRLHTEYSLLDGIVRVPELMTAVAAAGMPAVALTDQSNLFAMVKFYKEAQAAGVKPLIGVDAWIPRGRGDAQRRRPRASSSSAKTSRVTGISRNS
jgi:DNA polymerase-3 subunit alpha